MPKDPSEPIRKKAAKYPDVEIGTSCSQTSYKVGKTAFLYIGMQGGRHKAMFKLDKSLPEANGLAKESPEDYQVGSTAWVTARYSEDQPMPRTIWTKWLEESYQLSVSKSKPKSAPRKSVKKKAKSAAIGKKKQAQKKTTKRKSVSKKETP